MKGSLCLALFVAAIGFASASVKSELEARYREVTAAFKAKNVSAIENILMANYEAVGQDGRSIGRKQVLDGFKQQMDMVTDVTWVRKITDLKVNGSAALATVDGDLRAHMQGHKTLELIATTVDDWVKTPKGWKLMVSHLKSSKMLMNGKPMNMGH
jgi:ketosteroid isomerase-like protein